MPSSRLGSKFASATRGVLTGNQFTSRYTYFRLDVASGIGDLVYLGIFHLFFSDSKGLCSSVSMLGCPGLSK